MAARHHHTLNHGVQLRLYRLLKGTRKVVLFDSQGVYIHCPMAPTADCFSL
jgi:hypothetical protein